MIPALNSSSTVKTAKTDAEMKLIYSFPLNSFTRYNNAGDNTANFGTEAVAVGLKIYISTANTPISDYYGFYVLRMTPFFKADG